MKVRVLSCTLLPWKSILTSDAGIVPAGPDNGYLGEYAG